MQLARHEATGKHRSEWHKLGNIPKSETLPIDEVVCWFPVVECFITVGDVAQKSSTQPC